MIINLIFVIISWVLVSWVTGRLPLTPGDAILYSLPAVIPAWLFGPALRRAFRLGDAEVRRRWAAVPYALRALLRVGLVIVTVSLVGLYPKRYNVYSVVFSPDGKTIASGNGDKTVKLWDAQRGVLKQTLTGHSEEVRSVAFSPDGKTVVSGSADQTVKVWDVQAGVLQQTLTGHSRFVDSVAFSPNGRTVASGGGDQTVRLWDVPTGALQRTLTGHSNRVLAVVFSPDGQTLASGSEDKTVNLWDVQTGELQRMLTEHEAVGSVVFSPDGKAVVSGSFDKVNLWDVQTGELQRTLTNGDVLGSISYSPDGTTLACARAGRKDDKFYTHVELWDVQTGELRRILTTGDGRYVNSVIFSPDGRMVASGREDGTVELWDTQTGELQRTLTEHGTAAVARVPPPVSDTENPTQIPQQLSAAVQTGAAKTFSDKNGYFQFLVPVGWHVQELEDPRSKLELINNEDLAARVTILGYTVYTPAADINQLKSGVCRNAEIAATHYQMTLQSCGVIDFHGIPAVEVKSKGVSMTLRVIQFYYHTNVSVNITISMDPDKSKSPSKKFTRDYRVCVTSGESRRGVRTPGHSESGSQSPWPSADSD